MPISIFILFFIIVIIFLLYFIFSYCNSNTNTNTNTNSNPIIEGYNDEVGKYCLLCKENNTINKCLSCYNCVWIHNLRRCVHGDRVAGPYDTRLAGLKWSFGI